MDINETVSDRITAEKNRANIPWSTIAEAAGLPLTTFTRKRRGSTDWTATEIFKIADFLRITPGHLMGLDSTGSAAA